MSEIINQLQTLSFEDAGNRLAYVGMASAAVVGSIAGIDLLRTPRSSQEGSLGADAELVEQAISQVRSGRLKSRFSRWASPLVVATGVSVASLQLMQPTVEEEVEVAGVETMLLTDASNSMIYTKDMVGGKTRFETVEQAVENASGTFPDELKVGSVLFAANTEVKVPLGNDRQLLVTEGFNLAGIDSNGGSMAPGVSLAADILAGSDNPGGDTLFVITDGTIQDGNKASNEIRELAKKGTKVVVVLTGTDNASYTRTEYDVQPTDSSIKPGVFGSLRDVENVTIVATNDSTTMEQLIVEQVENETTTLKKNPTDIFLQAGLAIGLLGLAGLVKRTWKRQ